MPLALGQGPRGKVEALLRAAANGSRAAGARCGFSRRDSMWSQVLSSAYSRFHARGSSYPYGRRTQAKPVRVVRSCPGRARTL